VLGLWKVLLRIVEGIEALDGCHDPGIIRPEGLLLDRQLLLIEDFRLIILAPGLVEFPLFYEVGAKLNVIRFIYPLPQLKRLFVIRFGTSILFLTIMVIAHPLQIVSHLGIVFAIELSVDRERLSVETISLSKFFIDAICRCKDAHGLRHLRMHLAENLLLNFDGTPIVRLRRGKTLSKVEVQCHIDQKLRQLNGIRLRQLFYNLKRSPVVG